MYATCELLASFLVSSVFFSIEVFCGEKKINQVAIFGLNRIMHNLFFPSSAAALADN